MSGGAPNVHPHLLQWMILQQHLMASSAAMAANINRLRSQHHPEADEKNIATNGHDDEGESSEEIECEEDFEDSSEMLNNNSKGGLSQSPESSTAPEKKHFVDNH